MQNEFRTNSEIKWNPDGFQFLGPNETARRRKLLQKFHEFFSDKGFLEVKPPGFDFSYTFSHHVSDSEKEKILKSRDLSGKEISPSLDLTIQVVKGMSGFTSKKGSSKVYYTGKIVKDLSKGLGARREILQTGAEIIGHSSGNTFKLLLSLINDIASLVNLPDRVTIVLGNTQIVSAIFKKLKLEKEEKNYLTTLIYKKDISGLNHFLKERGNSKAELQILMNLLLSFQNPDSIIQELTGLNQKWKLGLDLCLSETLDILKYCSKMKNLDLCLDYSLVRDLDYYTGFIFHGYSGNISFPLVMGGAYDNLFEKFSGEHRNACGFAFNIDILEDLLRFEEI